MAFTWACGVVSTYLSCPLQAPKPPGAPWCTGGPGDLIVTDIDTGVYFRAEPSGETIIIGSVEPDCDDSSVFLFLNFVLFLSREGSLFNFGAEALR
jgi:hypothetical protein